MQTNVSEQICSPMWIQPLWKAPSTPRLKEPLHTTSLCCQDITTSSAGPQKEVTSPRNSQMTRTWTAHHHLPSQEPAPPGHAPRVLCGTFPQHAHIIICPRGATLRSPLLWVPACLLPCPARTTKGLQKKTEPQPPLATLSQTGMRLFGHSLQHSWDQTGMGTKAPQRAQGSQKGSSAHSHCQPLLDMASLNPQAQHPR